jgi:hypothetical protein
MHTFTTETLLDTDISAAKLLNKLSDRPTLVAADVFIWHGHLVDRATAVVALLKNNNQVPVSDNVKMQMQQNYNKRFQRHTDEGFLNVASDENPASSARIWFNYVCRELKGNNPVLTPEALKNVLIDLHKN